MNVTLEQPAEKLVFVRLLKNALLRPAQAGLRAGRQTQVELCEIPFAGTPENPL